MQRASDSFVSGRRLLGQSPTFNFDGEWRGPLATHRPTGQPFTAPTDAPPTQAAPTGITPTAGTTPTAETTGTTPTAATMDTPTSALSPAPLAPTSADSSVSTDSRSGTANQLYGGAECWVWILVAAVLGLVVGYFVALLCARWNQRQIKANEEKGTAKNGGLLRDPLRDLPAHISDTMVSHVEMGSVTSQPAVFFPGQSLRSETVSDSVMITGPGPSTLRDDVEEKKQQQLEREKVHHELERGMTLEGASYQYFHPDEPLVEAREGSHTAGDDDSPRVSFTFSTS